MEIAQESYTCPLHFCISFTISSMDETEINIKDLNDLTDRLADVREETSRYSQLATAQENLKHLFTVPETVKNTEIAIVEGKLLDAHKALSELEQSRDDLVRFYAENYTE